MGKVNRWLMGALVAALGLNLVVTGMAQQPRPPRDANSLSVQEGIGRLKRRVFFKLLIPGGCRLGAAPSCSRLIKSLESRSGAACSGKHTLVTCSGT